MKKNVRKNLIHDIIKYQFQTPVSDNQSSIPGIRPRPKLDKLRPDYYSQDNDFIDTECDSNRDCQSGEICLDGHCENASNVPDSDIGQVPHDPDPVNPDQIQNMTEVFSNIRRCTEFFRDHNHTRHKISYSAPNKAEYDETISTIRPLLTDNAISRMCIKLRDLAFEGIQPARPNPGNGFSAHITEGGR